MKKLLLLIAALSLSAFAQNGTDIVETATQHFTTGWDNFSEPLNLASSNVKWSVSNSRKMTVTFSLVGAVPNKLYQVGVHIFCTTTPGTFGQFPANPSSGNCGQITKQNFTGSVASVEMGVVTTDMHGKGSFKVTVGPIASGTYNLEFTIRNGAGCNLIGGAGNAGCAVDFQSPGPFGTTTSVVVP
ncbi:MAG: hypothetical protein HY010_10335 [Acidobacteria bacterium]|nr:hypothetical protein [Acidobacteriota bacterium]